ncbi:transcriptional regulator [Prauserella marina]|uniref:DNA-binding transcriptional regulator, AcrR family n=1 Tax=Prauserella marina TaxID=530584 RepID=A0A222VPS4_9PSEU|nr:helix-turn-helix domain-containing protein [Prauserella marina]ASR35731.1 transcriptional regulator [Prauserella marina]PWV84383.1 TetR family transcriptional regulator [Prauserella marina]SDC23958.1 DNA-binding transcriptional regulator, AcrR family [Prauserella marina]
MPRPLVPDRRGRILEAAHGLVLDRGWPRTTIADVAARAGIGKGAVYLEFPDKRAILDAVLHRSTRELTARVHRRVLDASGVAGLGAVYRFGVEALLADPLMSALFLGDDSVLGDHVRAVTDDRYSQRFQWLTDYTTGLQQAGVLDATVPAQDIVRMLSTFTVGLVHAPGSLEPGTAGQLSTTVGLFADLVSRGLAPEGPADPAAAREAQLALLAQLDDQLTTLEESP